MENKLNFNNFNKDSGQEEVKKSEFANNLDENKAEEDISSNYLETLNTQMNLEDQVIEKFSETNNRNLRESLLELRKAGEEALKELSVKVVKIFNSNKLVMRLRDNYIEKSGSRIRKELNNTNTNKLAKADDYDHFLQTVSSEFWGSSANSYNAIAEANKALTAIVDNFPEKAEQILDVWPKLLSKNDKYKETAKSFGEYLEQKVMYLEHNSGGTEAGLKKHINSGNDFEALVALSHMPFYEVERDFSEEVFSRIDSIVSDFPNVKTLPWKVNNFLLKILSGKPDEILSDSRRVDFIFNLWLNNLKLSGGSRSDSFKGIFPVLASRVSNCSEEETKEILDILNREWSDGFTQDFSWLLDSLPLEKNDLNPFLKKVKIKARNSHIISIKEDEINGQKISEDNFKCILEQASQLSSGDELIFISNLINKYPDEDRGISLDMVSQILNSLKSGRDNRFDLDKTHALSEIMSRRQWPDNLKEIVFSLSNIGAQQCLKILNKEDKENYAWVKNEPLLWRRIQLIVHQYAGSNDLRHYFYEVLDGSKQSDDFDDLIKSYAASPDYFGFDEVRNLFFEKQIDIKYLKYFIDKIVVEEILRTLEINPLSTENTKVLLESVIEYGRIGGASKALEKLFSLEDYQAEEKRQAMIDSMLNNLIDKINNTHIDSNNILFNDGRSLNFLSEKEMNYLGRKTLQDAFKIKNDDSLTKLVLLFPDKIRDFLPDIDENNQPIKDREEYLKKLFERLLPNNENSCYGLISKAYFSGLDLDIKNEETRLRIEKELLEKRALNHADFILNMDELDENQKEKFLKYFEENYSAKSTDTTQYICKQLNDKSLENFKRNLPEFRRLYIKLLNDENLSSSSASVLFSEEKIFEDNDIRDAFFSNLNRWPSVDGTDILEAAARRKSEDELNNNNETKKVFSLTSEEVKKISAAVMNNRGLSPRFWKNYLASGGENGDFYLDKNLFAIGLTKIDSDCFVEKAEDIVFFLKSIEVSDFEVKKHDLEKIITKAFNYSGGLSSLSERLENFYTFDPGLIEKEIFEKNNYSNYFEILFESNLQYSSDFKEKIIKYVFEKKPAGLGYFLDYLKRNNDQGNIDNIKNDLNKIKDDEYKHQVSLLLLNYDLLNAEESKEFYQKLTVASKSNVRTQILDSIDVISSMLSNRNNVNQLEKFLDNPQPEYIEGLKAISEFIEKYNKENKGRSIAVMLFAREYLPERKIEEVIDRVSSSLRKYQEILDKNSYAKIPDGLHSSIGMEYEITSSTATGYQELTSQSLKSDIARLSQAARIGSGNDAVHEIATKPTDNPYLMLLEMQLLHDIEYIDLNFSRSEDYQKGARGFHLTIGGEKGITVSQESNFLQNAIIAASWGGVQAGETGHKVNGGRGVSLRGRSGRNTNNIQFFNELTDSVELRSLSIDKAETLQRAVTTAFNGAIAIQAFKECFPDGSEKALAMLADEFEAKELHETINSKDEKIAKIANLWLELISKVDKSVKDHNTSFLDREMSGYVDDKEAWIDVTDFGGEYNQKRFQSIVENIDPTLSLEEYVKTTEIDSNQFFKSFNIELSDKLIKINNLYLKPGNRGFSKGDQANASSMLRVTKLNNNSLEYYDDDFLDKTIFDSAGEKRRGYYALQGASELILTHAVQRALLDFNTKIEELVN